MTHMGELDVKLPLGLLLDADLIKPDWEIWRNHSGEISCVLRVMAAVVCPTLSFHRLAIYNGLLRIESLSIE